jgi:hypothetical protein
MRRYGEETEKWLERGAVAPAARLGWLVGEIEGGKGAYEEDIVEFITAEC